MVKRIIWSRNALRDRVQILEYWYQISGTKSYSRKLDKDLRHSIKGLQRFPKMGRVIEEIGIRFIVRDHYQIFYKYTGQEIHILHLWDSRRNPDDLIIEE
ncbi:MAG: type II toxin-antitoxin system RelE/ParE family toxin [Bacteroidales bacterium]|nr:type II toxin-antitoxin system RelE/ParE family toxin [Bacteroidales bacterium]